MSDPVVRAHFLCIGCPLGCRLEVDVQGDDIAVRGQSCRRGEAFARQEVTDPRRVVTTTVAVSGGIWPRLSVRSRGEVPKALVRDVCRALHALQLRAPIAIHDVILPDALGTGIDVIATRDLPAA
jgi:CxxC motif-containing protein